MNSLTAYLTILILAFYTNANAQCDNPAILTTSETIYLDSGNNVVRTVNEISTIEISKTSLIIKPGNTHTMEGPVTDYKCKWITPFKNGKTVIKATVSNPDGESRAITLTIEGKDGVVTCLATIDNDPNKKIKLIVTKFE